MLLMYSEKKINDEDFFYEETVQPNESTISSLVVK